MNLNSISLFKTAVTSLEDYTSLIELLKQQLEPRSCILMSGDLGAGKTTFIRKFCESCGINDVNSPTFALHQTYANENLRIEHFDLYRLENADELETSGLWEILAKPEGLVFIEWPERLDFDNLPLNWLCLELRITKHDEGGAELRTVELVKLVR